MQIKIETSTYTILYFKEFTDTYKNVERQALIFYADSSTLSLNTLQNLINQSKLESIVYIDDDTQKTYSNYTIVKELSQKYDKYYCKTPDDDITVLSLIQLTDDEAEIQAQKKQVNTLGQQSAMLSLSDAQKDAFISQLGTQVVQDKLDIAALRGGKTS